AAQQQERANQPVTGCGGRSCSLNGVLKGPDRTSETATGIILRRGQGASLSPSLRPRASARQAHQLPPQPSFKRTEYSVPCEKVHQRPEVARGARCTGVRSVQGAWGTSRTSRTLCTLCTLSTLSTLSELSNDGG